MGVTWITDVLSDALGGPREVWYISVIFNSLQGVFIFIVIGCPPQILSAIKRIWCFRGHRDHGTAGTSNHHPSSVQSLQSTGDTTTNSITNTTKSMRYFSCYNALLHSGCVLLAEHHKLPYLVDFQGSPSSKH
ncbi:hypothetical protein WA026_001921 [Henosepilachna vigintioctopunctata]|uniref:Uncharacterized protein n=1 Tax=Henosepilachna vigintioctopunctata TaxID=420089 RepID=A0AAW1ULS8_9CUCU